MNDSFVCYDLEIFKLSRRNKIAFLGKSKRQIVCSYFCFSLTYLTVWSQIAYMWYSRRWNLKPYKTRLFCRVIIATCPFYLISYKTFLKFTFSRVWISFYSLIISFLQDHMEVYIFSTICSPMMWEIASRGLSFIQTIVHILSIKKVSHVNKQRQCYISCIFKKNWREMFWGSGLAKHDSCLSRFLHCC